MLRRTILALIVAAAVIMTTGIAFAQSPTMVPVQGNLADSSGSAINDTLPVTFAIYSDDTGAMSLWSETQDVEFIDGAFIAYLGSSSGNEVDLSVFRDYPGVWLGIDVAGTGEMPLFEIATAPFAGYAEHCGDSTTLGGQNVNDLSVNIRQALLNSGDAHSRYTDAEAQAAVGAHYTDADVYTALGILENSNAYYHTRYDDASAVAALASEDSYLTNDASDTLAVAGDAGLTIHSATDNPTPDAAILSLQTGATAPTSVFSVDAEGDTAIGGNLDVTGTLNVAGAIEMSDVIGPYNYREFWTDLLINNPVDQAESHLVLNMRCSGHWGSYTAEIELITHYYRPGIRRYTYYCGNGNHTLGGELTEHTAQNTGYGPGGLATLSLSNLGATGLLHNSIEMYDAQIHVNHPAYVQTYLRVRAYGGWPSHPAGTALSDSAPFAVWETWN